MLYTSFTNVLYIRNFRMIQCLTFLTTLSFQHSNFLEGFDTTSSTIQSCPWEFRKDFPRIPGFVIYVMKIVMQVYCFVIDWK